jgi:uncharacterized membrane protein YkoI
MRRVIKRLLVSAAVLALWMSAAGGMPSAGATEEKVPVDKLPKAVVDAVKARFPGAELKGGGKEEDKGKTIFEVSLKHKGSQYDVSLTPDGKIIEVEKMIAAKDLPPAVAKALEKKHPKSTLKTIEEITSDDKVKYEVILVTAEKKSLEIVLDPSGKILEEKDDDEDEEKEEADEEEIPLDKLPKPVLDAVKAKYPGAELKGASKEEKEGKTIYEVSLKHKESSYDVSLTAEGKIIEVEKTIAAKDLPAAVAKAIEQKHPKSTVKKAEEITADGKVKYEAVIVTADKKTLEVVLDPSGKILEEEADDEKEEGEK